MRAARDVNRGRFAIYQIGGNFSCMPSSATKTIDHATLLRRMAAGVISGARVIGQPGGWGVVVEDGTTWCSLAARRGGVRLFRRFETLAGYLREIGLDRFEVDVSGFSPEASLRRRPDTSRRMLETHEAAEHDRWFRSRVEGTLDGIERGEVRVISHDEHRARWRQKRIELLARSRSDE